MPFDPDEFRQFSDGPKQTALDSLDLARSINPDYAAKADQEAKRLGVEPKVVRAAEWKPVQTPPTLGPKAVDFYSNPDNAALAHDDVPNVNDMLMGVPGQVVGSWNRVQGLRRQNALDAKRAQGKTLSPEEELDYNAQKAAQKGENPVLDTAFGIVQGMVNPQSIAGGVAGGLTGAAGGSVVPGIGTVATGVALGGIGYNAGNSADQFEQTTGQIWRFLSDYRDEKGRGLPPGRVKELALEGGALASGINFAGNYFTLGAANKAGSPLVMKALEAALQGGGTNGLITAIDTEAKVRAGIKVDPVEEAKRIGTGALAGAIGGAAIAGGVHAIPKIASNYSKWADAVAKSKLVERSPETAREAIRATAQPDFIVPSEQLHAIAKEQGIGIDELAERVGARYENGEYRISAEDAATKIVKNPELRDSFAPVLDPEVPNREVVPKVDIAPGVLTQTQGGLREQLMRNGFNEADATDQATVIARGLHSLEDLIGLPQDSLYNQYQPKITFERAPSDGEAPKSPFTGMFNLVSDAMAGKFGMMNKKGQGGSIKDNQILVSASGNLSTFIHESGHLFRAVIRDAVTEGKVLPDSELYKHVENLNNWVGAKDGAAWTRGQEEKFARGMERYFREGKSPDPKLAGAFRKIKNWMTAIYATLRELRVPLDEGSTAFFDRLYSARKDIETAVPLGPSDLKANAAESYLHNYDTKTTAHQEAANRLVPTQVKANTEVHETSATAVMINEMIGRPELRLDRTAVEQTLGPEHMDSIPEQLLSDSGFTPDEIASYFGLRSGDDLLNELQAHHAYDPETDARIDFERSNPAPRAEELQATALADSGLLATVKQEGEVNAAELGKKFYVRREVTALNYAAPKDIDPAIYAVKAMQDYNAAKAFAAAGDKEGAHVKYRDATAALHMYNTASEIAKEYEAVKRANPGELFQTVLEMREAAKKVKREYTQSDLAELEATSQKGNWVFRAEYLSGVTAIYNLTKGGVGSAKEGVLKKIFIDNFDKATQGIAEHMKSFAKSQEGVMLKLREFDLKKKTEFIVTNGKPLTQDEVLGIALYNHFGVQLATEYKDMDVNLPPAMQQIITEIGDNFAKVFVVMPKSEVAPKSLSLLLTTEPLKAITRENMRTAKGTMNWFMRNPDVVATLTRTIGEKGVGILRGRQDFITRVPERLKGIDAAIDRLRQNAVVAGVASFNPIKGLFQLGDLAIGASTYKGRGNMVAGLLPTIYDTMTAMVNVDKTWEFSKHIENHEQNFNTEYVESVNKAERWGQAFQKSVKIGMMFVSYFDEAARKGTFSTLYKNFIEDGLSHENAVAQADNYVRMSFGSNEKFNDILGNKSAMGKAWGTFGIAMVTLQNLAVNGGVYAIPGITAAIGIELYRTWLTGREQDRQAMMDDPARYVAAVTAGTLVGMGTGGLLFGSGVTNVLLTGKPLEAGSLYAAASPFKKVQQLGSKGLKGDEFDQKDVLDGIKATARLTGIPVVNTVVDAYAGFAKDPSN